MLYILCNTLFVRWVRQSFKLSVAAAVISGGAGLPIAILAGRRAFVTALGMLAVRIIIIN